MLGHNIALTDGRLRKGLLTTEAFGDIELLMTGPAGVEVRVSPTQLERIVNWAMQK